MKNKIVLLHTRLSDYILNALKYHITKTNDEFIIFRKKICKTEAPFIFDINKNIKLYNIDEISYFDFKDKIININPAIIICSGWSIFKYNLLVKQLSYKMKFVLTLDNQWSFTIKQKIGSILFKKFFVKNFYAAWVPGSPQRNFALKIGFLKNKIHNGWYVANTTSFQRKISKSKFKRRFVFVGRYTRIKGIDRLITAFNMSKKEYNHDWKLHCVGTGKLNFEKKPDIYHHGFLQPNDLFKFSIEGGVFILPSLFEPWGVVVHEFSSAGYPLLLSERVGSSSQFIGRSNGLIFNPDNINDLKDKILFFVKKSDENLIKMSYESFEMSKSISLNDWSNTLKYLIKTKC